MRSNTDTYVHALTQMRMRSGFLRDYEAVCAMYVRLDINIYGHLCA
jgi:hypothetical protein